MRRVVPVLLALAAVLGLPDAAQAATRYRVVAKDSVYVRNRASGFVIGTVYPGEHVDVQEIRRRRWGYGLVRSSFPEWHGRRCGWVLLYDRLHGHDQRLLAPTRRGVRAACPRASGYLHEHRILKPGSYFDHYGSGGTFRAVVTGCADPRAYGEYSPDTGAFSHPYPRPMPTGRGVRQSGFGVRYRTGDGRAAMVFDDANPAGAPKWFFMRSECVQVPPVLIGRQGPDNAPNVGQSGSPLERPRTLHGTPGRTLRRTGWRFWGAPEAAGRGRLTALTCDPDCAHGGSRTFRGVRVVLSDRRFGTCRGALVVFYTRVRFLWPRAVDRKPTMRRLHRSCDPY